MPSSYPPLPDNIKAHFWNSITKWQEKLHLGDWRVARSETLGKNEMASTSRWNRVARQVTVRLGESWIESDHNKSEAERNAAHEMLHVLLFDLAQMAVDRGADLNEVQTAEHRIINVLEAILVPHEQNHKRRS